MRQVLTVLTLLGLIAAAWLDARAYVRAFCAGVQMVPSSSTGGPRDVEA